MRQITSTAVQSYGKGNFKSIEKCGVCPNCLKPHLKKACLNPKTRLAADDPDAGQTPQCTPTQSTPQKPLPSLSKQFMQCRRTLSLHLMLSEKSHLRLHP